MNEKKNAKQSAKMKKIEGEHNCLCFAILLCLQTQLICVCHPPMEENFVIFASEKEGWVRTYLGNCHLTGQPTTGTLGKRMHSARRGTTSREAPLSPGVVLADPSVAGPRVGQVHAGAAVATVHRRQGPAAGSSRTPLTHPQTNPPLGGFGGRNLLNGVDFGDFERIFRHLAENRGKPLEGT